jgi:hypothetical protein
MSYLRYRFSAIVAVLVSGLLFASCSDRNNLNLGGGGGGAVISANINGENWGTSSGYARVVPPFGLEIYGAESRSNISIYISPYNGPGNYQLNGNTAIIYTEGALEYTSSIGSVTITTDDGTYVEGTFNCQAFNSSTLLEFTNGSFGVQKQ